MIPQPQMNLRLTTQRAVHTNRANRKSRKQNELETRCLNMKKIIASVGMVALGSAGVHAANYGDLDTDQASKRWSVSAAVRGFYDDNYTTRPSGPQKRDSFGFEVNPSISLNLPGE